jgi:hypothetical protein
VHELRVEAIYQVPAGANLTDLVHASAADTPDRVSLARRVDGRWRDVTAKEFLDETTAAAKGLIALGVRPGDRVVIMSRTRYEQRVRRSARAGRRQGLPEDRQAGEAGPGRGDGAPPVAGRCRADRNDGTVGGGGVTHSCQPRTIRKSTSPADSPSRLSIWARPG